MPTTGSVPDRSWPADASIAALLVCLLFIGTHPAAFLSGHPPFPSNLLSYYEPWRSNVPETVSGAVNWILFDEVLEFYPWREFLRNTITRGTIPLWDPTAFCGYPFAGLFQNALLYPPDRLLDVIPFNYYPTLRGLLHHVIAAIGTVLYLHRFRLGRPAILFGAVCFSYCGFMTVWFGHPHMKTAVWLPFILAGIDRVFARKRFSFPMLTLCVTLCLTSGHIETALHIGTIVALYALVEHLRRPYRHSLEGFTLTLAAAFLAVLAAMGMALPFAEYLVHSSAYAARSNGVVVQPYLDAILFLTQLFPRLFGSNADGTYWYRGFNSAEINGGFIGVLPLAFGILAIIRLRKQSAVLSHALIAFFCTAVVYRIPPIYDLALLLPGYRMSYNFRLVLPMAFSMIVLASLQLDAFVRSARRRESILLTIGFFGFLLAASIPLWIEQIPAVPGTTRITHFSDIIALLVASATIIILATSNRLQLSRMTPWVVLALSAAELVWSARGYNRDCDPSILFRDPPGIESLHPSPPDRLFRTLPLGFTFPPHLCSIFGFHDIRGNDALTPLHVEDLAAVAQPEIRDPRMLPALRMMRFETPSSPVWDVLNIERVVLSANSPVTSIGDLVFEASAGSLRIFRNPTAFPRAFLVSAWKPCSAEQASEWIRSGEVDLRHEAMVMDARLEQAGVKLDGRVKIERYDLHEVIVSVETESPAMLVMSDTFFPGWQAKIDGKAESIHRVNIMMRGVMVPPGRSEVQMIYRPLSVELGLFCTFFAVLVLAAVSVTSIRKRSGLPVQPQSV